MANITIDDGENTQEQAPAKRGRILPRASLRAEPASPLEREPQRETVHGTSRRRRRSSTVSEDRFWIPTEEIPEGSSYEWKRLSVLGQEDPFYIASMREQGWEPVDPKRHPNWVPPGYKDSHIVKDGMILMERPIELTEEAHREQRVLAKTQVREAEQRLGMTPNNELSRVRPTVEKQMMRQVTTSEE